MELINLRIYLLSLILLLLLIKIIIISVTKITLNYMRIILYYTIKYKMYMKMKTAKNWFKKEILTFERGYMTINNINCKN